MTTFTPNSHTEYVVPRGVDRLWSRVPYQRGDAVLIDSDGNVTVHEVVDSDLFQQYEAEGSAFLGGGIYDITFAEAETLIGAGQNVVDATPAALSEVSAAVAAGVVSYG